MVSFLIRSSHEDCPHQCASERRRVATRPGRLEQVALDLVEKDADVLLDTVDPDRTLGPVHPADGHDRVLRQVLGTELQPQRPGRAHFANILLWEV